MRDCALCNIVLGRNSALCECTLCCGRKKGDTALEVKCVFMNRGWNWDNLFCTLCKCLCLFFIVNKFFSFKFKWALVLSYSEVYIWHWHLIGPRTPHSPLGLSQSSCILMQTYSKLKIGTHSPWLPRRHMIYMCDRNPEVQPVTLCSTVILSV